MKPGRIVYRILANIALLLIIPGVSLALITRTYDRPESYYFAALALAIGIAVLAVAYSVASGYAYLPPARIKKLCETGRATTGIILHVSDSEYGFREIAYEFVTPTSQKEYEDELKAINERNRSAPDAEDPYAADPRPERIGRSTAPDEAAVRQIKPGDQVTVLYHPDDDGQSTVYETSGYQVMSGFETPPK